MMNMRQDTRLFIATQQCRGNLLLDSGWPKVMLSSFYTIVSSESEFQIESESKLELESE